MEKYELVIVGAGPAGLSAAIYAARYHLKTTIIGNEPGGYVNSIHKISNFPSYDEISGFELMQKILNHVKNVGVPIVYEHVTGIKRVKKEFLSQTDSGKEFISKTVIFATGREKRKLGIKGETEFFGRGVSYCATCDAPLYKNKNVCVVGGSNSALTAAILASEFANKVYLIFRKNELSAQPSLVKKAKENSIIEILANEELKEILGSKFVNGIELKSGKKMDVDGVFIEAGSVPNLSLINNLKIKHRKDYIVVDKNQKTNIKGFYAAGDITDNVLKQVITSTAEGAIAAHAVYEQLKQNGSSEND